MIPKTIEWVELRDGPAVSMIDQTLLPNEERIIQCTNIAQVCEAVKSLRIRGAPAIGCAAAMGMALHAWRSAAGDIGLLRSHLREARDALATTRPTAVNLFWALERMAALLDGSDDPQELRGILRDEALAITEDDLGRCLRIGQNGAELIPKGANVLTHCNAGALATAGYGTALGVIRAAFESHGDLHVWADETRPLLQGARLTSWELMRDGIPCTVICDNMAGYLMQQGKVDCCVVGADRIAANGDTANKIGTYTVAVLAAEHGVPFYVAAPLSTVDYALDSGDQIPIEERDPSEVSLLAGLAERPATPEGASIYSPAFDVTPARLIAAIVTELGIARPPLREFLAGWARGGADGDP